MGRRQRLLIVVAVATSLTVLPSASAAQTVSSSVAETYRVAAETWKGHAVAERAKRKAAEADAADALKLAESWKTAAQSNARARTPEWVWPSVAATVVVSFVLGFVVAHRIPQP